MTTIWQDIGVFNVTASWQVELAGTHVLQDECHITIHLLMCNSWQWICQKNDSHQWLPKVWHYWCTRPLGCTILGRNWCCEAAEVSCNLHWLFDCVTNTHWTDGSTQRITEPCRLLGNTCPLWQTSTTTHITWTALQHMSKGIGAGWCSFYPSKSKHAVLGTNIQHAVEGTMCPAECRIKSYNCNNSIGGADARLIYTPTLTWTVAEYLHSSPELIFSPDIEQKHN